MYTLVLVVTSRTKASHPTVNKMRDAGAEGAQQAVPEKLFINFVA